MSAGGSSGANGAFRPDLLEPKFRGLLEAAPDAMVITGPDGRIVLVNRRAERLFGYRREELIGEPIEILTPERFRQRHAAQRTRYAGGPHVREMGSGIELYGRKRDGTEFPVDISLGPLETDGGLLVSSAIRDMTRQREEAARAKERADRLIRGLTELLAQPRDAAQIVGDMLVHSLDAAGLSTGLLYVRDAGGRHRLRAEFGLSAGARDEAAACFGHPQLLDRIVEGRQPAALAAEGPSADAAMTEFLQRLGHRAALVVPFAVRGETFGALVLASDSQDLTGADWIAFARSVSLQLAQAVALGQSLERLAQSEERYRALMEEANDAILVLDLPHRVLQANRAAERLLGRPRGEIVGRNYDDFVVPEERESSARAREAFEARGAVRVETRYFLRPDGSRVPADVSASHVRPGGGTGESMVLVLLRDVTERETAAAALRSSGEEYRLLFENNPHPMWVYDQETFAFLAVNDAALRHYGYTREEWLSLTVLDIRPPEDVTAFMQAYEDRIARPEGFSSDPGRTFKHRKKDGKVIDVEVASNSIVFEGRSARLVLATDVTEKRSLEAQLLQAQKMESIGRLAGGVAHDFNNLLGVISGYGELLRKRVKQDARLSKYAEDIVKAAERAAGLTRQLLAFSRKQVLQPKVLDLNVVVGEMEKMMRRLIGEDVQLVTVFDGKLGTVKADPGQIEQVIMNLAVNARDAMPTGGRLTIETHNLDLGGAYVRQHPDVPPGRYVMLALSDTGEGMSPEIVARAFEPFFTTKDAGKGTGLGLATVHGIVKQSGGHIFVYSEPGRGTTFKVYFPRIDAEQPGAEAPRADAVLPRGTETVLLVEDEATLRQLIRECLESVGYTVLEAGHGAEAIALAERRSGPIDLLMTDVVMPGISGRELAGQVVAARPGIRVIYMSGYTDDAVVLHGVLSETMAFLQKPFTEETLARKVREVLDARG